MAQACKHLHVLERELRAQGFLLEWEGKSWWRGRYDTSPGGGWLYFRCFLDREALSARLGLGPPVTYDEYDGRVAGHEAGFYCTACDSAVVGVHRNYRGSVPDFE